MVENVLEDSIAELSNYLENPLFKDSYTSAEKKEITRVRSELKKLYKALATSPHRYPSVKTKASEK